MILTDISHDSKSQNEWMMFQASILHSKAGLKNEWCPSPKFCILRLYWGGDNLG